MRHLLLNFYYAVKATLLLNIPFDQKESGFIGLWLALTLPGLITAIKSYLYLSSGFGGINWYSFSDLALIYLPFLMGYCLLLTGTKSQRIANHFFTIFTLSYAIFLAGELALYDYASEHIETENFWDKWMILYGIWVFLIALKLSVQLFSTKFLLQLFIAVFLSASLSVPYWHFGNTWLFYESHYEEGEQPEYWHDEHVFIAQDSILNNKLQNIQPSEPDKSDVFVVSFGGYGDERVFLREAQKAKDVLAETYEAENRSIALYNHIDTIFEAPIATLTNLRKVANDLADKHQEEDILVLYLTSHGHLNRIAVRLSYMELVNLNSYYIQEIWERSKFKWKILIISACYSGSFIGHLKDENTIILTASSKDRNSYGCADDQDLTFFGRSLFEHGLVETKDLIQAFQISKTYVTQQEVADGYHASYPQIHVGTKVCHFLKERGYLPQTTTEVCETPRLNDEFIGIPELDRVITPWLNKAKIYMEQQEETDKIE